MEEIPLISVIVPVYKAEPYINECIESLVNQIYQNLEIILVDDGSPDKCGIICDEWALKDERIVVIHKKNGGSAAARNTGLEIAQGEFISFVDSDDYLRIHFYQRLVEIQRITNAEIVECGFYTKETKKCNGIDHNIYLYSSEEALLANIKGNHCLHVVWNKIYKASVLKEIRFVEGKYIDDIYFTYKALGDAVLIARTNEEMYFYRQQADSVMHQKYSLFFLDAIEAKTIRQRYLALNYPQLILEGKIDILFSCMYHGQMGYKNLGNIDRKKAYMYLASVVKHNKLSFSECRTRKGTHFFWLLLERVSLGICCKLRNLLNIGL